MPRFCLVVVLLLVGSDFSRADAVSFDQSGQRHAAARIRNWLHGYHQAPYCSGSGTLVAIDREYGLVITAGHLFDKAVGPITVEFYDGQVSGGTLLAVDLDLDVAAVWIFAPRGIQPLPLAESAPLVGEQLEIWGYGPTRFRSFLAKVSNPLPREGDRPNVLIAAQGIEHHQVTIPGDSGGAMVYQGHVVGVHWGYRGEHDDPLQSVHAVCCGTVRTWLAARLPAALGEQRVATLVTHLSPTH